LHYAPSSADVTGHLPASKPAFLHQFSGQLMKIIEIVESAALADRLVINITLNTSHVRAQNVNLGRGSAANVKGTGAGPGNLRNNRKRPVSPAPLLGQITVFIFSEFRCKIGV
jgi:hypothetical protein